MEARFQEREANLDERERALEKVDHGMISLDSFSPQKSACFSTKEIQTFHKRKVGEMGS